MADINSLNREVDSLRKQLKKQSADADKARRKLIEENRRNLEAYTQQMHRAIAEHDSAAKAEYDRLLGEYRDSINRETSALLNEMGGEYARLASDVQNSRALLDKKTAELEAEIAALKAGAEQKRRGNAAEAQAFLRGASEALHRADALPHQKFEPGKLKIYLGAVKDGQDLYKVGLFEAASAVAVSARTGVERLILSVDDKAADWDDRFNCFALSLQCLIDELKQELADWEKHTGRPSTADKAEKKRRLSEINFWSRGEFADIFTAAKKLTSTVALLNKIGKAEYLKQDNSPDEEQLKEMGERVQKLRAALNSLSTLYKARYDASCARSDLAGAIADYMTGEVNLTLNEELTGYAQAGDDIAARQDFAEYIPLKYGADVRQDTRERFTLTFENASGADINVFIVPHECGLAVTNTISLQIDFHGADNKNYADDILRQVSEAAGMLPVSIINNPSEIKSAYEIKVGNRK